MYFVRDYDGPQLYQGGVDPDVLILGQDPTVDRHTRFATVLGLEASGVSPDRESKNLQEYLRNKILANLGIDESRILVANLVNLYYCDVPNRRIAKLYKDLILYTADRAGIAVQEYPDQTNGAILHALNFECRTRQDFERLVNRSSVSHTITLGEPVFQVLRERYRFNLPAKIRDVLSSLTDRPPVVQILDKQVSLLPLPHIFNDRNPKWAFYGRFLNDGLPRLSKWYLRR